MLVGGFIHREGETATVLLHEVESPYCAEG